MSRINIAHWTCPRTGCSNTITTRITVAQPPTCNNPKHAAVTMTATPKENQ